MAHELKARDDSIGTVMVPRGATDIRTVTITRADRESSFGFGCGTTTEHEKVITKVTEGGAADGLLFASDVIVAANGRDVSLLSHEETLDEMTKGITVTLKVKRADTARLRRGSISQVDPQASSSLMKRRDSIGRR
mmetsp:Transcript_18644/g.55263  ORF Transcript_18644/g.55263 Transcript_18644/m.55263 type:complete len:136 (-) Transcript_18644:788-1195(-)